MKYILDFDRVLFDHDQLTVAMQQANLQHLYADPALWDELNPADFLYPDAIPFLTQLPKEDVYIVSAYTARIGPLAEPYQDRKLAEAGIAQYVQDILIMDGPKAPHVSKVCVGPGVFVDDKRAYVEEVMLACPNVRCIQLIRPHATRSAFDQSTNPDLEIPIAADLAAVTSIIDAL